MGLSWAFHPKVPYLERSRLWAQLLANSIPSVCYAVRVYSKATQAGDGEKKSPRRVPSIRNDLCHKLCQYWQEGLLHSQSQDLIIAGRLIQNRILEKCPVEIFSGGSDCGSQKVCQALTQIRWQMHRNSFWTSRCPNSYHCEIGYLFLQNHWWPRQDTATLGQNCCTTRAKSPCKRHVSLEVSHCSWADGFATPDIACVDVRTFGFPADHVQQRKLRSRDIAARRGVKTLEDESFQRCLHCLSKFA